MALTANDASIVAKESPYLLRQDFPVAASAVIFQGAIVTINATGFAVPAVDVADHTVIGRCRVGADNTGGADGAITVTVDAGIFGPFVNTGSTIAQTNVGSQCGIVDDNAVTLTVTNVAAGRIFEVITSGINAGVFVAMLYPASSS